MALITQSTPGAPQITADKGSFAAVLRILADGIDDGAGNVIPGFGWTVEYWDDTTKELAMSPPGTDAVIMFDTDWTDRYYAIPAEGVGVDGSLVNPAKSSLFYMTRIENGGKWTMRIDGGCVLLWSGDNSSVDYHYGQMCGFGIADSYVADDNMAVYVLHRQSFYDYMKDDLTSTPSTTYNGMILRNEAGDVGGIGAAACCPGMALTSGRFLKGYVPPAEQMASGDLLLMPFYLITADNRPRAPLPGILGSLIAAPVQVGETIDVNGRTYIGVDTAFSTDRTRSPMMLDITED